MPAFVEVRDTPPPSPLAVAARHAADIWDGGACNPRALARELVRALDAAEGRHTEAEAGAPARVILAQLAFILRCSFDGLGGAESSHGYVMADMERCNRLAGKEG